MSVDLCRCVIYWYICCAALQFQLSTIAAAVRYIFKLSYMMDGWMDEVLWHFKHADSDSVMPEII